MPILKKDYTKPLPVELTDAELLALGSELAQIEDDLGAEEVRQHAQKEAAKARVSALEARQQEVAGLIRRRRDVRPVACRLEADYLAGVAREFREDTGEQIFARPLATDEKQTGLPLGETAATRGDGDGEGQGASHERAEQPVGSASQQSAGAAPQPA